MPSPTARQFTPRVIAATVAAAASALLLGACGSSGAPAPSAPSPIRAADFHAAAVNPVTVSPLPGTPDANPATQISFLGGPGTTVSRVSAVGSMSGRHSGSIKAYSTATGASYLPAHPFAAGEHVRVSARVTQSGSTATVHTTFTVALQAPISQAQFPENPGDKTAIQHYLSAPTVYPTTVRVTTPAAAAATPGDFFLAPYQGLGRPGQMIVDRTGNLIWFHPAPAGDASTNFRPQSYQGHTVLTWWQGRILALGFGQGVDQIWSTSYRPLATIAAGNGYSADLHEFRLTPQGTAWIDEFDPVIVDLSAGGGSSHAVVNDSIVQEIDVRTGLVMWEWHALGHIALGDSYSRMPHTTKNWDYVHVNSIDPGSDGDVLLSARGTWTVYDVDMHTGSFVWQIGGKHSSFTAGPGTSFFWQHDAEWQTGGLVSVFDNGSDPAEEKQSRGLLLSPNTATHSVTLVKQFTNPSATLLASSQGNLLSLPGGNWLMGYGGLPNFTEYDSAGQVLFDATLGKNVQDFRTYLAPWSATPKSRPVVAAQPLSGGGDTVEVSWNGATEVASWKVMAASSADSLATVTTVAKSGFETTVHLNTSARVVAVAALDAAGHTIGTSAPVSP
jgi:Arylsulfotransferase (ASST)